MAFSLLPSKVGEVGTSCTSSTSSIGECSRCTDCRICVWNASCGSLVNSLTGHSALNLSFNLAVILSYSWFWCRSFCMQNFIHLVWNSLFWKQIILEADNLRLISYLSGTLSQITLNMPPDYAASKVALWTAVITPFTKYALLMNPLARSIEELLPIGLSNSFWSLILLRTALVISSLAVAFLLPFFGSGRIS